MSRETLNYDVVIVGAGPAGLAAAIRLKQLNPTLHICLLEKGSEVGAHILSGAVLDPRALNELFMDGLPQTILSLLTPASTDRFLFLSRKNTFPLPLPKLLRNPGHFLLSLGQLCQWLSNEAEKMGVEIYTGFAAVATLQNETGAVCGVITGDKGLTKEGTPGPQYQAGIAIQAKHTLLGEGCHGSLSKKTIAQYQLGENADPQTYALGIKELWEVRPENHRLGEVVHTVGWPLDRHTYGGGFIYHLKDCKVALGLAVGLDYQNPYLDPFSELQRFKLHPKIKPLLEGATRIGYGARSLCEGGYQSLPTLHFPGGLLIGDAAGFLNVAKMKGIHMAMKSGMVAAETLHSGNLPHYKENLKKTWLWSELHETRNIRPGFRFGLWPGLVNAALEYYVWKGLTPWTLHNHADHRQLKKAKKVQRIDYPLPDQKITFDKITSLSLANLSCTENQPSHLSLSRPTDAIKINLEQYAAPEQFYCPAKVYEILPHGETPYLQINASNCLHCKACDIKDPSQNITWAPSEGGTGPQYREL